MHHYHTALDLLDQQDHHRGSLLLALGEAALTAGAEREAVQAFEAAQTWFTHNTDVVAAARAAYGQGRAWARLEDHAAAQAAFEQALTLLHEHACSERVQILADLATLLAVSLGKHTEGMAYGQQALELARQLGKGRLEAMANRVVGNLLVRSNELPTGIPLLERALTLALAANDPAEAAECCACLTMAYFWSGQMHSMKESLLRRMESTSCATYTRGWQDARLARETSRKPSSGSPRQRRLSPLWPVLNPGRFSSRYAAFLLFASMCMRQPKSISRRQWLSFARWALVC